MITDEQRLARRSFIGSSDAAAIFGLDPWRTAWDVFAEKTGIAPGFAGNAATDRGNRLEPVILDWAEEQIGAPILRHQFHASAPICANLDADCPQLDAIVEAKSTSNPDEWGEQWTDQVPERTIVQTHVAMGLAGRKLAYVPVLLPAFGRFDFRMYQIEFRQDLWEAIRTRLTQFWAEHVEKNIPPENCEPSADTIKNLRRQPGKVVAISGELVDVWLAARDAAADWKKRADRAHDEILLAMLPDAEGATTEDGRQLTYFPTNRQGYEVKPTTFRTLRLVGQKKGRQNAAKAAKERP